MKLAQWELHPQLYQVDLGHPDREYVLDAVDGAWAGWVTEPLFLVFAGYEDDVLQVDTLLLKASKRGNDVYNSRLQAKLRGLTEAVSKFSVAPSRTRDGVGRGPPPKARALFVTFTWGHDEGYTIGDAWDAMPGEFNRWITGVRAKYGKCAVVRTWECHKSGYPHAHALLVFESATFAVYRHQSKVTGKESVRLQSREERDALADRWGRGFVDVQAVTDIHDGVRYVTKYIAGVGKGRDAHPSPYDGPGIDRRTVSMCWIMGKRQFSISGLGRWFDLIHRCTTQREIIQITLNGSRIGVRKWEFIGIACLFGHDDRPPPWSMLLSERSPLREKVLARMRPVDGNSTANKSKERG